MNLYHINCSGPFFWDTVYYNGAQRYDQFLWVSWLYRVLILLGSALYHLSASVSSIFMVLCT